MAETEKKTAGGSPDGGRVSVSAILVCTLTHLRRMEAGGSHIEASRGTTVGHPTKAQFRAPEGAFTPPPTRLTFRARNGFF
jgi:hypothetical protein